MRKILWLTIAFSSCAFAEDVILQVKHSGKCAQVNGASQANGANITQWDCLRQLNVQWEKVSIGGPYFLLYAAHTTVGKEPGKCAQVDGRSHANGANVSQWDCLSQDNVKWSTRPAGDGYVFLVNKESGKCMQVDGMSKANGANISQWDCVNQDNVKWKIERVPHGLIPFDKGSAGRPAKN
ncbi:MAG TPA: RICIN domain-containing protein [Bryobacteraceae bacterium]|jgi:hypothetical protein